MSQFPKTARHPNLSTQVENWRTIRHSVNVKDDSRLSDIPSLHTDASAVEKSMQLDYIQMVGEIICAQAIRALAKCYESLDALVTCDREGVSISAAIHAYNGSFFAAKSFCMLMGFGPFHRDSPITVDAFSESSYRGSELRIFDKMELHRYRRWGHDGVWKLTRRIIDTVRVPNHLEEARVWLRRASLKDSYKFRNAVNYDDRRLSPIEDSDHIDFPDRVSRSILATEAPDVLAHQFIVAKHLILMCNSVLDMAGLKHLLWSCASKRRIRQAHEYAVTLTRIKSTAGR